MEFKLIVKKINNTLSPEEEAIFDQWKDASFEHQSYFDKVQNQDEDVVENLDLEKSWGELDKKISSREKKESNPFKRSVVWKYASAIAVLVLAASPFVFYDAESNQDKLKLNAEKIVPGADKAVLTLENGSHIALEAGEAHKFEDRISDGKSLIYTGKNALKSEIVKYNYLTIPRGGKYLVALSDGTKVWLNSDSKLKYPVKFQQGQPREVELVYGEAYFDVSPSANHNGAKFKVSCQEQVIEVHGTEFNVKAYQNENESFISLVEGKVLVSIGQSEKFLNPGQQSIHIRGEADLEVISTDLTNEIAWKDGLFNFDKKPLEEILNILSRWYDIEDIHFQNEEKKNMIFSGTLRRTKTIGDLLVSIQETGRVEFEIKNKGIYIK